MTTISHVPIRGGDGGSMDTLTIMAQLVNDSLTVPLVVDAARRLAILNADSRDTFRQAIGIRSFLGRVWRFVEDPTDRELLRTPEVMLREYYTVGYVAGDCDEAAVLGASLAKAIGLGATFTVYAFSPADGGNDYFSHVFATILTPDGRSVSLDVTKPAGSVPSPSRELTVEV